MTSKIRVYGKAQNRTALGIANAYLKMYPNTTLEDLNKAFPISLNSTERSTSIFVDVKNRNKFKTAKKGNSTFEMFFFEKNDEVLTLKNGQKIAMLELWTKDNFDKLVQHVKQYDIEVAEFLPREGFKKGGFRLEFLNGYTPPTKIKFSDKYMIFILLVLFLIAVIIYLVKYQ